MDLVFDYLEKELKIQKDDKIVIGVSTGPDSMGLLYILEVLRKKINFTIIVAHVNHNKRKESEEEEEFLKNYCQNHDLIFEKMKIENYNHDNFQQEARKIRYNFYKKLVDKYRASYLMTAHHGDDLVETILMRLVRGSSLSGYKGIPLISNMKTYLLVRPLLFVTKEEIEAFDKANNVEYRIDKSNYSDKYTRNRYRHKILPFLKEENPNVHLKFLKFSNLMSESSNYIENVVKFTYNKVYQDQKLNILLLKEEDIFIQKMVLEYILKELYEDITLIQSKHINILLDLIKKNKSGSKINLPLGVVAKVNYDYLVFKKEDQGQESYKYLLEDGLVLPNGMKFVEIKTSENGNNTLHLNSHDVKLPLYVRNKEDGDYIELKGTEGKRKVKDIFIDKKINRDERSTYPVVVDSLNRVIWVPKLKKSKFDSKNQELCDIIFKCL